MRRVKAIAAGVVAVTALCAPTGVGAQAPGQDSLEVTGATSDVFGATIFYRDIDVRAVSGPSGENATGRAFFFVQFVNDAIRVGSETEDNVSCLAVTGSSAVLRFLGPFGGSVIVKAVDNGPANSGLDEFLAVNDLGNPADCVWRDTQNRLQPLTSGDVTVRDAQPFPTSKDQCRNGGWRTYAVFKNQGDCVSFVATGGKNQPSGA
jgi:hypothetical protein